jgi:release factor glutamine methyltransferase
MTPDAARNGLYTRHLARVAACLVPQADKPEETAASTLHALWCTAAGQPTSAAAAACLAIEQLPALNEAGERTLCELIERRLAGTPLAHLSGRQSFMGIELEASPEALIPRVETALLGERALAKLGNLPAGPAPCVIDVCTGSGNLALALAAHARRARVIGADLSPAAIALAKRNAVRLGLADRVNFVEGDLFEPCERLGLAASADLIVCNPPYISSAKVDSMGAEIARHEPRAAFDGGPLGNRILERLMREAPRFLKPGGWLGFEVGLGQGAGVARRLARTGHYATIESVPDAGGAIRALFARRPPP